MTVQSTKAEVRAAVIERRRALSANQRQGYADALLRHLPQLATTTLTTVCAYVPIGTEPGVPAMLDALVDLGLRVLLPVTRADQPLYWGEYHAGQLVTAAYGLREPAEPTLAPEAIAQAQLILVPALAVDRQGVRLGRGAGFYDRSLHLVAPGTRLVAVVHDDELVEQLPAEPHDVPMTHAFTPGSGLVALGFARAVE